ncbi:MAG: DUF1353 domain-containing protein [Moraxellaceae bacterium]
MAKFTAPLELRLYEDPEGRAILREDRTQWLLMQDLPYGPITAKQGYVTDLGSIPRIFWRIESPSGRGAKGYVIHDYGYTYALLTREQVDRLLRDALRDVGVPYLARNAIYLAVRAGGKGGYGRPSAKALDRAITSATT